MRINDSADKLKEFSKLIKKRRPREALVLFLKHSEDKFWRELKEPVFSMLDMLWMVNNPDRLRQVLELLTEALAIN